MTEQAIELKEETLQNIPPVPMPVVGANGQKRTEQKPVSMQQVAVELKQWLAERKVRLTVRVQTPQGELISPENFIPPNWKMVVDIAR